MISRLSEITTEGGEVIIECVDWNSRIANHSGLLEHDESNGHLPLPAITCLMNSYPANPKTSLQIHTNRNF